jgi:putative phosphoesterase
MRIGVLSDIHDALHNLEKALTLFENEGISTLLFCGDFCSPIPCRRLKAFPGDVHCVFGNGDGDRWQMMNIAATGPENLFLHGEYAVLEFNGRKAALTHYPFYGEFLARSGDFDAVFNGHTHERAFEMKGRTLWANPGDIMGWKNPAGAGIWDTGANAWQFVTL